MSLKIPPKSLWKFGFRRVLNPFLVKCLAEFIFSRKFSVRANCRGNTRRNQIEHQRYCTCLHHRLSPWFSFPPLPPHCERWQTRGRRGACHSKHEIPLTKSSVTQLPAGGRAACGALNAQVKKRGPLVPLYLLTKRRSTLCRHILRRCHRYRTSSVSRHATLTPQHSPLVTLGSRSRRSLIKLIHDAFLSSSIIFCFLWILFFLSSFLQVRCFCGTFLCIVPCILLALCSIKAVTVNLISYLTGSRCVIAVP